MDNEASSTVMNWLERNKVDTHKVSTHNHQANIVERMIETAKHHFIPGMVGTDENYPIREWDRGVAQPQRTLNMLLPCRVNPKFLADAFLEGQHDYNAVPFPPPWDSECLYLKDLTKDHHGDFMGWRASVWAPQRNTTGDTGYGSQQQEQSGYQTQWCSFHRKDTRTTSQ